MKTWRQLLFDWENNPESGGSRRKRIRSNFSGRDEMDSGEADQIFSFNPRDDKLIRKAVLTGQGRP